MFQKDIYTILDGRLDINHHRITGLLDSIDECDAVTKQYVLEKVLKLSDSIEGKCFRKDIYTFLVGHLDINHHRITGLLDAIDECDAVTKQYVLEKVQKLSDSIEIRYLRKNIHFWMAG